MVISMLLMWLLVEITGADASAITTQDLIWAALLVIGDTLILKSGGGRKP